ncbi:MAG TPA: hypothetical protein VEK73_19710, partial [Xanthobacteraceae bacterium]|nr:hypothetical protein [Xanthobacteraceae bacterium]
MQAAADPSNSNAAAEAVAVVLLLPELVGGTVEAAQLRRTLGESPGPARALLCLTEAAHLGLAAA